MSNAYSYDLRRKVIEAIELDGMRKSEASEVFHISRNTINLWLKRKAHTGDYRAKSYKPPGHSHKIRDWEKFRAFSVEHSDRTQAQMAQLWGEQISERTISRALKKIGFTRKKNLRIPGTQLGKTRPIHRKLKVTQTRTDCLC